MRTLLALALLVALSGCQWGSPPRIAYVDGTTYVAPDGHREELVGQGKVGTSAITPYRDGFLVADTRWFEGSVGLAYVRGRERTDLGPCSTSGGRPSPDRRRVAWLTTGCPEANLTAATVLHVAEVDGSGGWTRELERPYTFFAVGFLGDAVVLTGWLGPVWVVPRSGPVAVVPRLRHAVDVHETLVAGRSAVVDTATGRLLWQTPGTELIAYSPDGRLLVGIQGREAVILDARTGAVRATLPRRLDRLTWEDDTHLLAVTWGRGREAIVRVGLDGRAELVGPVRPVPPEQPYRYVFETQP